ncbi:unnamed protein product [Pleuronectes platessa]|uniref:Serine/threonine-protein phosphatase 6 regulatory ankyrin repeat subunit A n=2 Tax=Pleuronectes platessa TaxID=8262 RepID=A0A9N7YSR4_PLEPL|nr:unnamed protein product [Pleuronectes platessa]
MFIVPVNVESKKKANAGNMSQMEELKLFVSERLQAAVSDVCGAFEKTLAGYEEQNSRLKDENNRYRSLLDVVLLSKLPQTKGHAIKSTPAAASQVASDSSTVRTAERTSSSHVVHVNKSTPSVATILVASDISSAQMAEKTSTALAGHVNKSSPSAATILVASDICSAQTAAKTSTAHAGHANKSTPTADASLVASDSTYAQMTEKTSCYSADTQCLFTSHANFFKLAANDNCPLCLKSVQATEKHLMKRHYRFAVHFIEGDTEKFVVPCFCTEKAQGRSHWHCPCCIKIIHRKSNFEAHLSKQHADAIYILQQSQDAVSQAEFQHPELIPKSESQVRGQSLKVENDQDSPVSIIYVDGFIQDMSDINCVQSSQGHPRPLDTQPDSWVGKEWQPAEDGQDTNGELLTASSRLHTGNMAVLKIQEQPSLLRAIFNVDPGEVRSLIFKKEDVNIQDNEKRTPLHAASYLGDAEIIELLILSGARVNAKDNKWLTPLHRAVASCSEDAVTVLLKHSADVNARDKNWQTPLHVAASNKAVRCAEALVPLLSNVNVSDRAGRTALHHAAFSGHVEMVKLLLSRGANINAFDKKDRRAIHWAAYMGHLEVVKLLVASGAEVDCKDKKAYTPLHAAASSGMSSTVHYLLGLGVHVNEVNAYGNTPLHLACYNGQDVVVSELIETGANVNQVNERGFSALHFASSSRQGALCQDMLLAHGAHINMRSKDGKTPLHMAATHGRFSCSQALIQNGAEIDCEDKSRNTALHIAARYGHELIITALVKHGASTANRGIHGMFPLHLAALSGFSDCCRKLLSSGFDIDTPDDFGRTCLHAAAAGGNLECVNLLLNIGADFNRKDNFGRTPLHYASANCNYQCVFALVGSGAGINELDQRGCCPLHYAAAADTDGKCVEYLLRNDADPAVRDSQGFSAVHYASAYGRTLCLELMASETPLDVLMETSGTEILSDLESQAPVSPLHLAAYHGHCGALEVLLSSLLEVDVRSPEGRTPLSLACSTGHQECVSLLLHHGASPMTHDYTHKKTAIHAAAMNGHPECLRLLMSNNDQHINVDLRDTNGQTPLMLAVLNGHTECVYSLLSQGASVENQDRWGRTALHRGAVTGQEECVEALLQRGASVCVKDIRGRSPLHLASACGRVGALGALLQATTTPHTDTHLTDNQGYTPLHWACYNGYDACVEVLLDQEAFRKIKSNSFSPLHCAVMNDNDGVAEMLIDCLGAAIINTTDSKGRTPLHAAAFSDHVECVSLLLSHGAQANVVDTNTCTTPLMMAALNGQTNAVEMLVSCPKADMALQDTNRNTALHLACSKGHETSALLIMEKISDRNLINCTNAALQTPLHVAAKKGLTVVVQELLGKGASVLAVDENGYTPALACAPNRDVADCLALILNSMMPTSSIVTIADLPALSLAQTVVNHHPTSNHISKGVAFDALPPLRPDHASHCRPERPLSTVSADEEMNDSDSETY